jgi:capsular polysaccharide biosynthesis protein
VAGPPVAEHRVSRLQAPDLLRGLRRHWVAVVVVALLGSALGALATLLVPDTYVSRAQVSVVHDARLDLFEDAPADTYETVDEANRRMQSAAVAALSSDVVERTAEAMDMSREQVSESVTVEPLPGADVLVVSGSADDPDTATELARAVTDAILASSREAGRQQLRDGALELEGEAAEILANAPVPVPVETSTFVNTLYARALELRTRATLYVGVGELVTDATEPATSAAPGPLRGAGYGLAGGLLAGVAVALLLSMRRTGAPPPSPRPAAVPTGSR